MTKFSVLISVYIKENPKYFKEAINSIVTQTLVPNEIVLVKDGPLSIELENVINEFITNYPNLFNIIELPVNKGLGYALSIGLLECRNELIARMDTDDICTKDRFEKQINFLNKNNWIDVLGTNVEEFMDKPGDLNRFRKMPIEGDTLKKYSKFRNPMNHPTVIFRKSKVLEAGNYNSNIFLFEDFSLFIRMLKNDAVFYNLQESLLYFRTGLGLEVIKRRSGINYVKNEWKFAKLALKIGHLNFFEWLFYITTKLPLRFFPLVVILFVYNKFLRD